MTNKENTTFDTLLEVYTLLNWTGVYKLIQKPNNRFKEKCHQIYRVLVILGLILYNLQHIVYMIQNRLNVNDVFDALMLEIPHFNFMVKILTLNLQIPRIDKVNKLISDDIFAADTKRAEDLLLKYNKSMHRFFEYIFVGLSISICFWPASYFGRRYQDSTTVTPFYVPFDTTTWGMFSLSVALLVGPIIWVGYGHIGIDCLIVTYYAQAGIQLKMIKHNIEHLFDANDESINKPFTQYRDETDKHLKRRFVYYVHRYEKVAWYIKEVDNLFNPAISCQFFTATVSLCAVAYKMSSTRVVSLQFVFLGIMVLNFSSQIFFYCYYGNKVQHESQSIGKSLYLSDWLSVSPQFRRLLLIAMVHWSRTLTPKITSVIPLSLNNLITFYKSVYSLYAVLSTRNL